VIIFGYCYIPLHIYLHTHCMLGIWGLEELGIGVGLGDWKGSGREWGLDEGLEGGVRGADEDLVEEGQGRGGRGLYIDELDDLMRE
jgi:hypothetical protein